MFDEIKHTRPLGDLLLSNRSTAKCTVRFKLDSGCWSKSVAPQCVQKVIP